MVQYRTFALYFDNIAQCTLFCNFRFSNFYWNNKEVAIKRIVVHERNNENYLAVLRQEGKLLLRLKHPNIVSGFGFSSKLDYVIMEYNPMGSIGDVIRKREHIMPNILVDWAIQIALGMNYLHNYAPIPLLHRDLKPDNVLLFDNVAKISDLGSAKPFLHTTQMTGGVTYHYTAPESIKHHLFSKGSDVWSYGEMLWVLLIGKCPYEGMDINYVIYNVGQNQITLPIPSTCPELFSILMTACHQLDYRARPSFENILKLLNTIKHSDFTQTQEESFYNLQDVWRAEIKQAFEEPQMEKKIR